jgi:hypothetical protein
MLERPTSRSAAAAPTKAAKARHAERTRHYRERIREGRIVLRVQVEIDRLVPMLVSGKNLEAESENRCVIARALERAIEEAIATYELALGK